MAAMVENGWLGKKTGKGFYLYPKDAKKGAAKVLNPEMLAMLTKHRKENGYGDKEGRKNCFYFLFVFHLPSPLFVVAKIPLEDIQLRVISRFINEAAYCLQGNQQEFIDLGYTTTYNIALCVQYLKYELLWNQW